MASHKPCLITVEMITKTNRVNEEKLLNEMFIILEYSDSFKEFVSQMSREMITKLMDEIDERDQKGN